MYERRISIVDATALGADDDFALMQSRAGKLSDLMLTAQCRNAPQHGSSVAIPPSLAARYAAANSITRRRFDALLREGETTARMGFNLLAGRAESSDPGSAFAARFLGRTMSATLHKLEKLVDSHAS